MSDTTAGMIEIPTYKRDDFTSDQIVRWCPGCGDYSILAQMQKAMPDICKEVGVRRENVVFISGIGCSSRFPYYMNTYGFHSIHGRAPTLASGVKISNPDLQVWIITGDGDGLSIGGNHLIHCLRRNLDVKIILFNNRIYGLTKGQYSPTSEIGKITKSSPFGSVEQPINPLSLAIAAEASFVARAIDTDSKSLQEIFMRAAKHKGAAFVEVFQNCNVFNNHAFASFTDRGVRADKTVSLVHGEPLVYGKERDQCVYLEGGTNGLQIRSGKVGEVDESEVLIHDERADTPTLSYLLSQMGEPDLPVPLGVFRAVEKPVYEDLLVDQIESATEKFGEGDLAAILSSGDTWEVAADD